MTFQVQEFQAPKNGSKIEECQDAMAWDLENGIYAIADGVSDSAFQQKWAKLLVASFVDKARASEAFTQGWVSQWLETQQKVWQSQVNLDAIPWHGRMKAVQIGGEATFLGIRLNPDRRSWSGIVIGDCNLFHFDQNCLFVQSIPFHRSEEFSNTTQAFSSISRNYKETLSQVKVIEGKIKTGDYLLLTTDAMARWMLGRLEAKKNPLQEIPTADAPDAFHRWVNVQRQSRSIKDDDTSLLLIQADPQKVQQQIPVTNGAAVQAQVLRPSRPAAQGQVLPNRRVAAGVPVSIYLASLLVVMFLGLVSGFMIQSYRSYQELRTNIITPLVQLANARLPSQDAYKQGLYKYILNIDPKYGRVLICKADPSAPVCKSGK